MPTKKVKFFDRGGHDAGRGTCDLPGVEVEVSGERFAVLKEDEDPLETLRSPWGAHEDTLWVG